MTRRIGFDPGARPPRLPAPRRGEHSRATLAASGCDAARIGALAADGVIGEG